MVALRARSYRKLLCLHLSVSFACLLLLSTVPAHAEGLLEVYELARKNDPYFQAAQLLRVASQEKREQAVAALLPNLVATAEQTETTQDIKSSDNQVFGVGKSDFGTTRYGITLTQPIFHWDSIVGLKQADAQIRRSETEYALAAQELFVRVTDLYLKALAAQDQLAFAQAEIAAVEKLHETASARQEMGLIPITDLHDAVARMETTRARAIAAQNLVDDTMQAIEEMTGEKLGVLRKLKAEISLDNPVPTDIDQWVTAALEQSPAIAIQLHEVEVARQEVRRQNAGHYPTLDLLGRYSSEETDGSLFGGGSQVDSTDILLQFSLPIYQGGQVSSRVREASAQLGIAEQKLAQQQRAVKRAVRSAYLGVNGALKRVEALDQSVIASQLAKEAKQEGFRSGIYTSLAVLDAERDLFLVKQDYAQARYDYLLDSLRLKQTTGSLSESDIGRLDSLFIE